MIDRYKFFLVSFIVLCLGVLTLTFNYLEHYEKGVVYVCFQYASGQDDLPKNLHVSPVYRVCFKHSENITLDTLCSVCYSQGLQDFLPDNNTVFINNP